MGITSSDENFMSIRVGSSDRYPMILASRPTNSVTIENVLEWLFAAAALIVVCFVLIWR